MDAGGASAASSSSIPEKYDVFLSFRGEETRNNFISHLFAALKRKQIETYIDDKSLERGDDITLALPEAIQKSKISIIIFPKDYASSSWCLRELVHILECRRENKQMVIPIFYEVDPSEIRKQTGSYRESFQKHEDRFKDNMEMVKRWRAALTESADLSGWDSEVTRPESELVEVIVDDVLRILNRVPSSDVDHKDLVGIEEQIQEIERRLSLGSSDIRIIGIWGLGGIGKTTLADLLFNKHCYQFESCCFLANVREESDKLGLINLRDKLISKLLKEESMNLGTPSLPPHVKDRLRRQKVLIVLDDVNNSEQLQILVGDRDLFGHGSRIIVTTRDANVLKNVQDCLKLDQNGRHNIMNDFRFGVLRKATRLLSPKSQALDGFQVKACYPGDEIPRLFEYQWKGSFINLKPPPNWWANNILGFMVCVVAVSNSDIVVADSICKFNVKENQGENHEFGWKFFADDYVSYLSASNSSNVYMWYARNRDFCSKFLHAEEVSFDFSLRNWDGSEINSSKYEVKKCGFHVLYRQNLEEFINLRNQHRHVPDHPEPRAHRTNDFDTEERECY